MSENLEKNVKFGRASLIIGIIIALFTLYFGYAVFFQHVEFSDHKVLAVFSGLAIFTNIAGLVSGIIGTIRLKSKNRHIAIAGMVLCLILFFVLPLIDLNFFPAEVGLGYPP